MVRDISRMAICLKKVTLSGSVLAGRLSVISEMRRIKSSPVQKFSEVRAGNIKYRDLNGNNVIDNNDQKAIGYSTAIPEIYYGINLGFEYKGFGVDALFKDHPL